jgi:hypothetical protein
VSSNADKALTFVFHSDASVNFSGWKAVVNCTIQDAVHEQPIHFVKLYPNPVDRGNVKLISDYNMEEILLHNMSGSLVKSFSDMAKNETLDLRGLKAGVYMLTIKSEAGIQYMKIQIL